MQQVGLVLKDLEVLSVIAGGPAFQSGKIDVGDIILSVDNEEATKSTVAEFLEGAKFPGSNVRISVRKAISGEIVEALLLRARSGIVEHGQSLLVFLGKLKVEMNKP